MPAVRSPPAKVSRTSVQRGLANIDLQRWISADGKLSSLDLDKTRTEKEIGIRQALKVLVLGYTRNPVSFTIYKARLRFDPPIFPPSSRLLPPK